MRGHILTSLWEVDSNDFVTFSCFCIFINMKTFIYTLSHPITNEVRYVGKTTNIKRRYYDHVYRHANTYKGHWVKSLLSENLKPILTIIEECDNNWAEREKYWITQYSNLTNSTSGGESFEMTELVKEKLRLANRGNKNPNYGKKASTETKLKLSEARKKWKPTQTHKDNIRKSANKKPCIIDEIVYESTMDAARKLMLNAGTIYNRIVSKNFVNYRWV